jgi:hypothetical protein
MYFWAYSEFNQFLMMTFVSRLTGKPWWAKITHRKDEMKMMLKELELVSGPENQILAKELRSIL